MPILLQINSVANTGSTGRIAEQLGQLAMSQGWVSYIAYGREARESKSQLIRIGSTLSVISHVIFSRFFDRHGLFSRVATKKFLKQIDEIKPDIVHIHNIHGYYINFPMLLRYIKDKNIPTVITMHDFWLMTGHCAYINNTCDRWKIGCGSCPRLEQYPAAITDHTTGNWQLKAELFKDMPNVTLVPVSNWLNDYISLSLLKNVNIDVIYNGVDTDTFKPYDKKETTVSGIDWKKFTIMCIATRWTNANGMNDVLRLSTLLSDDAQVIIVGLDENQIKELPAKIIGLKKIENYVQLQELYTKSDVIFNPNREVTFGLITAEAMACGTPVIVLKNTAGEEIVDAETGYVINSVNEVPALISTIKANCTPLLSSKCRKRIQQYFSSKKQFHKYLDLYQKLINLK